MTGRDDRPAGGLATERQPAAQAGTWHRTRRQEPRQQGAGEQKALHQGTDPQDARSSGIRLGAWRQGGTQPPRTQRRQGRSQQQGPPRRSTWQWSARGRSAPREEPQRGNWHRSARGQSTPPETRRRSLWQWLTERPEDAKASSATYVAPTARARSRGPRWWRPEPPDPPATERRPRWFRAAPPESPARGRRQRRPRSRRVRRITGCLLWVATILLMLLILSILFGGFQRGSRVGGSGQVHAVPAAASRGAPG